MPLAVALTFDTRMVDATAVNRALGNRLRLLDQLQDYMETVKEEAEWDEQRGC